VNLTPQTQQLHMQATALQHHLQNSMHANPMAAVLHREVTTLKNDIASGKNSVVLNERMKKINTMLVNDQRTPHYQPPAPATHFGQQYQPGQFGNHLQTNTSLPAPNVPHPSGPSFSYNASNQLRYGLRQMSTTLNQHPKF
jgi:hypothetical protein